MKRVIAVLLIFLLSGCTKQTPKSLEIDLNQIVEDFKTDREGYNSPKEYAEGKWQFRQAVYNEYSKNNISSDNIYRLMWDGFNIDGDVEKLLYSFQEEICKAAVGGDEVQDNWDFNLTRFQNEQSSVKELASMGASNIYKAKNKSVIDYLCMLHPGFYDKNGSVFLDLLINGESVATRVEYKTEITKSAITFTRRYGDSPKNVEEKWVYKVTDKEAVPIEQSTTYDEYKNFCTFKLMASDGNGEIYSMGAQGIRLVHNGEATDFPLWGVGGKMEIMCDSTENKEEIIFIGENKGGKIGEYSAIHILKPYSDDGKTKYKEYSCDFNTGLLEKEILPLLHVRYDDVRNSIFLSSEDYPFRGKEGVLGFVEQPIEKGDELVECNFIMQKGIISATGNYHSGFTFSFPLQYTIKDKETGKLTDKGTCLYGQTVLQLAGDGFKFGYKDKEGNIIDGKVWVCKGSLQ